MTSLKLGGLFHIATVSNGLRESSHDFKPDFGMCHFTPAETDGNLQLVALGKELGRLFNLRIEIPNIDIKRKTDFFCFDNLLVFTGFLFSFGLLETKFAVIHDSANWRRGL